MASLALATIEDGAREAPALIRYLDEGDFVTRRYVSQGAEMNTGDYRDYPVTVRDGMPLREHFALDTHGFMIAKHETAISDFYDKASAAGGSYQREVEALVARLTGADKVSTQGWMIRTSGDLSQRAQVKVAGYVHACGIQPPGG